MYMEDGDADKCTVYTLCLLLSSCLCYCLVYATMYFRLLAPSGANGRALMHALHVTIIA